MALLSFTPNLRRRIKCPDRHIAAGSVAELLESYFLEWPDVRGYVLDDQSAVRKHIMILVDGLNLRDRRTLSDPLHSDSEVFVFQALSGG